ncbi:MAG TPA: carboxypeptidase-like regulatory domain-containing protein, partial [Chitinophagales bacterium]|nr:carboxypeptidase-like regulatory domain-containing protein [Chitinophagales bacterium]
MKQAILLFIGISSITALTAQTTISGTVTDNKKNLLPGANIFLKDTYDGTTSNVDGTYSFITTETGKQILSVSFVGYESFEDTLQLNGGTLSVNIVLKEAFNELNAVVITAG